MHPATLEPGEEVLVAWWDVLEVWRAAMETTASLARWGHDTYVYGESSGWDTVQGFLEHSVKLHAGQFALTAGRSPGFQPKRDGGFKGVDGGVGRVPSARAAQRSPAPPAVEGRATAVGAAVRACAHCGQTGATKVCSKCKAVVYCSRDCQKADWKAHKKKCAAMAATRGIKDVD